MLSFAAAAASLERPGQAGAGRIGEARAIYSLQGSSSQPLEMFTHRESHEEKTDRSVCSLKYKNVLFLDITLFFFFLNLLAVVFRRSHGK